jgi:hypothetical protein
MLWLYQILEMMFGFDNPAVTGEANFYAGVPPNDKGIPLERYA